MEPAYGTALQTVASLYEAERAQHGGKSLARIATILVNNGKFFQSVAHGKPFLVTSLERVADWFRRPANWPAATIPPAAASALYSMGRPPLGHDMRSEYRTVRQSVDFETPALSKPSQVAAA